MLYNFSSMFSSSTFIVLDLTFKSLINFEFSFVYGINKGPISFFCIQMSSLPTVINWRNGKVTFNHDHLKAEMCDKPVGKVMGWRTCQDHVEFGDPHLIPTDMWVWSCVDVFSLLEYKPLPNKRSLWASSIVLLSWVLGHSFGFCLQCHSNGWP